MKKQFTLVAGILLGLQTLCSHAQTTITIGSGTSINSGTSYPAPYGNYYWGAKHQMIIRASELTAAGASAGNISSLAFNVSVPEGVSLSGFTIKLKNTTANACSTSFDNSGLTTVWGPQSYTETAGWNTHTFSTSFYWNGTSNLLIETCFNNSSYTYNAQMYYSTTSFSSSVYYISDASGVCSYTTGSTSTARPNMRLNITTNSPPVVKFTGSPSYSCDGIISFTDSSAGTPTSWLWAFGDSSTSTSQNPAHTYAQPGAYSVSLKACNSFGCDSLLKSNYITYDTSFAATTPLCSPTATSYCCSYGIYAFNMGALSNTSGNASEGYKNFACKGVVLTEGNIYSVSLQTGPNEPEDTKIWIDFNNDSSFNTTTEQVFSSTNQFNPSGTITIPGGATLNTPLRLRIISDESGSNITPCGNPFRGQAEDYTVVILPDTNPPIAAFFTDDTASCSGIINLTDNSQGVVTSWLWEFGDGTTDTLQNPVHTYTATGTYSVKLVVCNAYGCDSTTYSNYINIVSTSGGPVSASCTPATTTYCCDMGIYNVTFNTINNTSNNGIDGYMDYSCTATTTVTASMTYSISVTSGTQYSENVGVWIDYDNNGNFTGSNEFVFYDYNSQNHTGSITIPGNAITNTALRMRVYSDYNSPADACSSPNYGQVEDYSVIIQPNTNPPVAAFSANPLSTCSGTITFTDTSMNTPTSWVWDFGDSATSTSQNPVHNYTADGSYSVKLTVCNAYGCDSVTYASYITVALAQSPVAASCTPPTTTYCCGMGVTNVTFNSINNTTSDGIDGYKDYSCSYSTTVTAGNYYNISVTTGWQYEENVRVWIDLNNNGSFESGELIFSSNNVLSSHSSSVLIPASGALSTPLRMRVYSDYADTTWGPSPGPCVNPQYGQIEDYTVIIQPNTNPPVAAFGANTLYTCSGAVSFSDSSLNVPTSWLWDFGDGSTSTAQSPTHNYTSSGTYTVTLKVCNSYGCDSIVKNNYITVNYSAQPVAAYCTPNTSSYCCGYGIYNVTLNSINNSTADGVEGYQSYTCGQQTDLTVGLTYTISVTTNPTSSENVRVWIDYNNNGSFTSSEMVLSSSGYQYHSGSVTIPSSAVQNTALRMRVFSDYYSTSNACTNPYYGQAEDYKVTILPNTNPPDAEFATSTQYTCSGVVSFSDSSLNVPTSWLWNFGDGTTSTAPNPTHNYTASGTYTVTLKACNAYGCDSITKNNYITVNYTAQPVAASCSPNTSSYCCGYGIYNVTLNTINNTTSDGIDGYESYTCDQQTGLTVGLTYAISVITNPSSSEGVKVWIDYNNNGSFTSSEQVFSSTAYQYHSGYITIPSSAVQNTALRMRVFSDYYSPSSACSTPYYGQIEDYMVTILPNTNPPDAAFAANAQYTCSGAVSFSDSSLNVPTSWLWNFGDGTSSTAPNPTHNYTASGTYTVTLKACNAYGCDSITKNNYITVNYSPQPVAASCTPATSSYCCGYGIYNVTLNTINNTTPDGVESYQSYTCTQQTTLIVGQSYAISVTTNPGYSENVRVWIDFNNNGSFTSSEQVFASTATQNHTGTINIPATAVQNTPLRMRVFSDNYSPSGACSYPYYGQIEDYKITILPYNIPPIGNYTYQILDECQGIVKFTDNSAPTPSSWLWNFGDITGISNQQNPYYAYDSAGAFAVTLIVSNAYGSDTVIQTVTINVLNANFSMNGNYETGSVINFTDNTTGATSWAWDFGDGYAASIQNPAHVYLAAGIYTVTMQVSNAAGCIDQEVQQITIISVGIDEKNIAAKSVIAISPNPSTGKITVSSNNPFQMITIRNIIGEDLKTISFGTARKNAELNLSSLPAGLYFINVTDRHGSYMEKVVLH